MKIKCIIIDDEPLAIKVIENHLSDFQNMELVATFNTAIAALPTIEESEIDVIFLDINMPKMSGLDFLRSLPVKPHIVITTAYREYAVESFDLDVLDYLVKPIPFGRFLKAINKVTNRIGLEKEKINEVSFQEEPYIFLKVDKKLMKIKLNDILYIESLKDYIKVITITGDYLVHKSMTSISEELPQENFLRIHRSFAIAINKITSIEGNSVEIANRRIPIGRNYLQFAKQKILNINNPEE
ncbi:two component transcriptional regulator, LytTR family [Lutibacter agarilyticus]|uniref:Two component transcriptional regulator, LytTR family n=1 Tax=Lutibacter agarilyticus TaxID=1109740 RepID=A0A238WDJ2_9FLAO|nr:LytTR family DNA-binding domain-containing protein [Lutibacter agarilyticus]SNR44333.1 two component transcriptional regulator, LytTR family [Lutibacter agarilyticus]